MQNQPVGNNADNTERSEEAMGNQQNNIVGDNTEISMESDEQRDWPDIEDSCRIRSISSGEGSPEVYFHRVDRSLPRTKMPGPKQFLQKVFKCFPGKE